MPVYRINRSAESYGQAIGILMVDVRMPFVPGDVGNASTFGYPVIYKIVPGLTSQVCVEARPEFKQPVIDAARALADQGVRGISSDCGFMLAYQDVVREMRSMCPFAFRVFCKSRSSRVRWVRAEPSGSSPPTRAS